MLISIIVPMYNVSNYLVKCLDSIIHQSYSELEIILVNDGSTDDSELIANKYRVIDERVKIINQSNQGPSAARNIGVENANGEYIMFVDADDYLELNACELLVKAAAKHHADIVIGSHTVEIESTRKVKQTYKLGNRIMNNEEALKRLLLKKGYHHAPWEKLFKKQLFGDVKFPIGQQVEDLNTTYKLFIKANTIVKIKEKVYNYLSRDGSESFSANKKKIEDYLKAIREVSNDVIRINPSLSNIVKDFYSINLIHIAFWNYRGRVQGYDFDSIYGELKSKFWSMIFSPRLGLRDKIKLFLIISGLKIYK